MDSVGDGSCGGFIDDTEDVESSEGAGILGGLALGIIETVLGEPF